jgi:hypothetical protein
MKEKLIVKNFSVIDDVEIDIKKINILIGPQSTGKSIIAKLVYFFRTVHNVISTVIFRDGGRKELNGDLRYKFNKIFPDYLVLGKPFEVSYYYGDDFISIKGTNKSKSYKSYRIQYSENILNEMRKFQVNYKKQIMNQGFETQSNWGQIKNLISFGLAEFMYGSSGYVAAFIPAGRSFFVNIEKNIFTLQAESSWIDQMLIDFGAFFEIVRKDFKPELTGQQRNFDRELHQMCIEVLGGEYEYLNNFDFLKTDSNRKIFLRDSSSGQQEVLPLIASLLVLSRMLSSHFYLSIEEPETHLFPDSQRKIVEIIAMVYNLFERKSGFFITTHSPYILTAFNNLIQAENTRTDILERFEKGEIDNGRKEESLNELDKIISPKKQLAIDDVSVYSIQNGKCKDIKDKENNLIDANEIDEVSDTTSNQFGRMLDISYGE